MEQTMKDARRLREIAHVTRMQALEIAAMSNTAALSRLAEHTVYLAHDQFKVAVQIIAEDTLPDSATLFGDDGDEELPF